jgi:hypothetical protein
MHVTAEDVPRFGSGVQAVIIVLLLALITPGFIKLNVVGRSRIGKRFFFTMLPISLVIVSVQIANAFGAFGNLAGGVMYYGLVFMLVVASAQFIVLIIDAEGT